MPAMAVRVTYGRSKSSTKAVPTTSKRWVIDLDSSDEVAPAASATRRMSSSEPEVRLMPGGKRRRTQESVKRSDSVSPPSSLPLPSHALQRERSLTPAALEEVPSAHRGTEVLDDRPASPAFARFLVHAEQQQQMNAEPAVASPTKRRKMTERMNARPAAPSRASSVSSCQCSTVS